MYLTVFVLQGLIYEKRKFKIIFGYRILVFLDFRETTSIGNLEHIS